MIHPHTYIHPNAQLATNVKVDPFTVIHQNVEIGEGTWIGSNVTIMEGARIGRNCRIFPGAVIAAIPQDLKFHGEVTTVEVGDNGNGFDLAKESAGNGMESMQKRAQAIKAKWSISSKPMEGTQIRVSVKI